MSSIDTPAPTVAAARRGRGRPTVIDADRITRAAFEVWSTQGYAQTGWKEIADATGVSVRSLIRHFGSRSALAWGGVPAATERLTAALTAYRGRPTADAIRLAVVASASGDERIGEIGPEWVHLVSSEPELLATAPAAHGPWNDVLAAELHGRLRTAPLPVCAALAEAYRSVAFAAMTQWAREGATCDPATYVDAMLRWLDVRLTTEGEPS